MNVNEINYPGAQFDKEQVEKTLDGKDAKRMLLTMRRRQQVHDGSFSDHRVLKALLESEEPYPGFDDDKEELLQHFVSGHDFALKRFLEGVEHKSRVYSGDRTDPVVKELDSLAFTYNGWEDNAEHVVYNLDRKDANRNLESMKRKQQLHDGTCDHSGIIGIVQEGNYTYPGFQDDKHEAMILFSNGYNVLLKRTLEGIRQKQRLHEGDRSDDVVIKLDKLVFTYSGWKKDRRAVVKTLDRKIANRILLGMKRKEQLLKGTVKHRGILRLLRQGNYNYPGFKTDKQEALHLFSEGYEVALKRLIEKIDKKQQAHFGNRTDYDLIQVDLLRSTFNYEGWEDDAARIQDIQYKDTAVRLFKGMQRKQDLKEKKNAKHPGIRRLQKNEFSYPGWDSDKKATILLYSRGHDASCQQMIDAMDQRQRIYDTYKTEGVDDTNADTCVICLDKTPDSTFVPCGHMCLCSDCAEVCRDESPLTACPICLQPHTAIIKIYHS